MADLGKRSYISFVKAMKRRMGDESTSGIELETWKDIIVLLDTKLEGMKEMSTALEAKDRELKLSEQEKLELKEEKKHLEKRQLQVEEHLQEMRDEMESQRLKAIERDGKKEDTIVRNDQAGSRKDGSDLAALVETGRAGESESVPDGGPPTPDSVSFDDSDYGTTSKQGSAILPTRPVPKLAITIPPINQEIEPEPISSSVLSALIKRPRLSDPTAKSAKLATRPEIPSTARPSAPYSRINIPKSAAMNRGNSSKGML